MTKRELTKRQTIIYKTRNRTGTRYTLIPEENQMAQKVKQFLLHMWHPSCYSCYKPSDKLWMKKGPHCDYNWWNICDTDNCQPGHDGDRKTFEVTTST